MSSHLAATLARLRVCRDAGVAVPRDLLAAAIECLEKISSADMQRTKRNDLIRRAALFLPRASSYTHAKALAAEAKAMSRSWARLRRSSPSQPFGSPRDCLHAARLLGKLPESTRQFYRVLQAANADTIGAGDVSGDEPNIMA